MVSIKLKFRPSHVEGKEGSLYFQVIHRRNVRQLATGCKIMPEEWNASTNSLSDKNADSFRAIRLTDIRQCIRWQQRRINRIVLEWEASGRSFTTDDLINGYRVHHFRKNR